MMQVPTQTMDYISELLKHNVILYYIANYKMIQDYIVSKIPIKFIRRKVTEFNKFFFELKIINSLEKYDIERIMYDFAQTMNVYGIDSNKLFKLRKLNNDLDSDYGITFTIFTDYIRNTVTGINIKIWTKDKMAKLNLKLVVELGDLNLNITWAYKNKNGVYVNYNRTEDILVARDEIKSILIEYITKQAVYLMNI